VNMRRVKARKDAISEAHRSGLEKWLKQMENCTVYEGHARFESARLVRIGPETITADQIFINVGGRALVPPMPGLERVPLFVVSDRADEIDRVLAFEFGADDFLPRPFFPRELAARVRALLRGYEDSPAVNSTRTAGTLRIDLDRLRAEVAGRRIDLTPKELQILAELLASAGKVVRRRELIERLWGSESAIGGRAIDAHIKNIRQKLGASRTQLETVRGVGYRISEAD